MWFLTFLDGGFVVSVSHGDGGEVFMRSRPERVNGLNAWTVEHVERLEHREHLEHAERIKSIINDHHTIFILL